MTAPVKLPWHLRKSPTAFAQNPRRQRAGLIARKILNRGCSGVSNLKLAISDFLHENPVNAAHFLQLLPATTSGLMIQRATGD